MERTVRLVDAAECWNRDVSRTQRRRDLSGGCVKWTVQVGVVTVLGHANVKHDTCGEQPPEFHQKSESCEGDKS